MMIKCICELVLASSIMFFFFNDTATTEIYTLSLHDALPIFRCTDRGWRPGRGRCGRVCGGCRSVCARRRGHCYRWSGWCVEPYRELYGLSDRNFWRRSSLARRDTGDEVRDALRNAAARRETPTPRGPELLRHFRQRPTGPRQVRRGRYRRAIPPAAACPTGRLRRRRYLLCRNRNRGTPLQGH